MIERLRPFLPDPVSSWQEGRHRCYAILPDPVVRWSPITVPVIAYETVTVILRLTELGPQWFLEATLGQ